MKFSEVIGHEDLKDGLRRAVTEGRVSHALMFAGDTGCGSLAMALAYVQYLNCTNRRDGDSCGECASCRKIQTLEHPDLHIVMPVNKKNKKAEEVVLSDHFMPQWREIVGRTGGYFTEQEWYEAIGLDNQQGNISVGDIGEMMRKLSFKSFEAEYKAVIIWLPEKMKAEPANAMLKILEEPWDKTLFVLVSQSPEVLLPTIISRTQPYRIGGVDERSLAAKLMSEGIAGDKAVQLARMSGGNLIEARRLAEGEESAGEYFELFVELMRLSYNNRHLELIGWAERVAKMGREPQKYFLENSVRLLRNSYMLHAGMTEICHLWGAELEFCRKFSPFIGNDNIEKLVYEMECALAQVRQNGNANIIFTHFALTVSKLINPK
ncbi:MAG: DNA polymerase III subunit delta [Rikenellaceae bacterium]|nr:DNA polymerase III subunit delta [Rikenellaceae bacterium]